MLVSFELDHKSGAVAAESVIAIENPSDSDLAVRQSRAP